MTCFVGGIKDFIAKPCPILQAAADTLVVLAAVFTVLCLVAVLLFTVLHTDLTAADQTSWKVSSISLRLWFTAG